MKARRSPVKGPLLTFALMIGSVAAVGLIAHYYDSHQSKAPTAQTTSVSASSASGPNTRE